jgi:beta-1,4-mannooligosaccharide/beta-1,4-mannosyl-N-acetylglucosamine phosphorylase
VTRPHDALLFQRSDANPILTAADVPYPANSVFNPGAATVDGETILLLRVEDLRGISQLHVVRSADGISGWRFDPEPLLRSDVDRYPEEIWGCEDPRLTWLPEREEWGIAYTAYSRRGPLVSLATTRDFRTARRLGPAMPPEDKDAALLPRRIGGRWAIVHRPAPVTGNAHMWISFSPDLRHWGDHTLLLEAREGAWWDAGKIGLGPPPLETPEGWLVLYHGVHETADGAIYRLGLALLDLEEPWIVRRRTDEWAFGPAAPYELTGDVGRVVFPCGWIHDAAADRLRLYYGAADSVIGLATASFSEVLARILAAPVGDRRAGAPHPPTTRA